MSSQSPGKLIPFWTQNSLSYSKSIWLPKNNNFNIVSKNNYENSLIKLSQNTWFNVYQFNSKFQENYKLPFQNIDKLTPKNSTFSYSRTKKNYKQLVQYN
jgi:hypothetical protein